MEPVTCASPSASQDGAKYEYFVSLADHDRHLLHVAIRYHAAEATPFLIPVWNALYQVRDFAQYVTELEAHNSHGDKLAIAAEGKSSWRVAATDGCAVVTYTFYINTPGPFSAQADAHHVFINWAQVLLYSDRAAPLSLSVTDIPPEWNLRDLGLFDEDRHHLAKPVPYDVLVDSPVEISASHMTVFDDNGARYRIVVDANPADYDLPPMQDALRRVVHETVDWMDDHPFEQYTFLFHFPHAAVGGGMEHSYGTAVSAPADRLRENSLSVVGTAAHEFFHLWNVKRIRPQSMEPVDYEHEQSSRMLWFCEGVTSDVSEMMMTRAGLEDERNYLSHLSGIITDFESRPAHKFQSAEASSLEAWMEGRAYYRRPERSVSYYTSGEVLGVLLDLQIRQRTGGKKTLRDLFQLLNTQYAKQQKFYDDERGLQTAAETVAGGSFQEFFGKHVAGSEPIPYDEFFKLVGLKLETFNIPAADAGFEASVNFTGLPEVTSVTPGSAVEAAGVRAGDTLAAINEREYMGDFSGFLLGRKAGETLNLRFITPGLRVISVPVKLAPKNRTGYSLVDLPTVTAAQRRQRAAWITGDDAVGGWH